MAMTEDDLRELLDRDSGDGPCGGVAVAAVDRRVRRMRRRRAGAAGAVALTAFAVVAVAALPGALPLPGREPEVWTGALARPTRTVTPSPGPVRSVTPTPGPIPTRLVSRKPVPSDTRKPVPSAIRTVTRKPVPTVTHTVRPVRPTATRTAALPLEPLAGERYRRGGVRERFTFRTGVRKAGLAVTCPAGSYALLWFNGRLVGDGPCDAGPRPYSLVAGAFKVRRGDNEVMAAVIPASSARRGEKAATWAGDVLAATKPYPAKWTVAVVENLSPGCKAFDVATPGTDEPRWFCGPE
ncbi:hypothetical protein JYK22_20960, partial [Nonomuraea sp. RK-328]|nr:hypothetical protein [Nonomuraea sp. RK-328]